MNKHQQLTPDERARITELQDFLIERFVEHKEAIESGEDDRAQQLQGEIDSLLRERKI